MKTKRNFAVRTAMIMFLAVLTTGAWATDFITDVMLIGGSKSTVNDLKTTYTEQGWKVIDKDLNAGCGASSDYIFLLYKSKNCQAMNVDDYITGFYLDGWLDVPDNQQINNVTYQLVPYDGGNHFKSTKGDLNSNAGGATIHLYYTKVKFNGNRAVSDITFNDVEEGSLGSDGEDEGCDLNIGARGEYIYMHVTTVQALPMLTGDGSNGNPFLINNADEWSTFTEMASYETYAGSTFKLTENIPTASDIAEGKTALNTMAGITSQPFTGHFIGNGKSINVNILALKDCSAPFQRVSGATIENLTVNGNVLSIIQKNHLSGLVGACDGGSTVIRGCTVNANVTGKGYLGGIVGHGGHDQLTIDGCVYNGTISDFTAYAGGLMGWCDEANVTITHSLFKGTFQPGLNGLYHPIACKNSTKDIVARGSAVYYLKEAVPTANGNYLIIGGEGTPVSTTSISGQYDMAVTAADGITYYAPPKTFPIVEAPDGVVKNYNRSGNAYLYSDNEVTLTTQSGLITMVYADNNEVYLYDPVCTSIGHTYIKGKLNGNRIVVQLPQAFYVSSTGRFLEVAWVNVNDGGSLSTNSGSPDRETTIAIFTIDGNTIRLENSNKNHVLGAVWDGINRWYGSGDFASVYTENTSLGELVTPPAGITPVTYDFLGMTYFSNEYHDFHNKLQVLKDGNDVYIQGLATGNDDFVVLPKAWVKGTLNGNTLTIPKGQFLGAYSKTPIYMLSYDGSAIADISLTYIPADDTYILNNDLYFSTQQNEIHYYCATVRTAMASTTIFNLVQVPESAIVENDWMIDGTYSKDDEEITVNNPAYVAFDGNDVYIKGISYLHPNAWIKGTLSGNTATFPSGQFVGQKDLLVDFLAGHDGYNLTDNIVFSFNRDEKTFFLETLFLVENNGKYSSNVWNYYYWLSINKIPKVQIPEGLEISQFYWSGLNVDEITVIVSSRRSYLYTDFKKFINIGIDGNDVYVQGISSYFPDAWVKGTISGNTATFAKEQFLGNHDYSTTGTGNLHYFMGYDGNELCDVVFNYDPATKTFSTYTWMVDNGGTENLNRYGAYAETVWSPVIEAERKPANPSFNIVSLTSNTLYVGLIIPTVDTEDFPFDKDKVYYRLFSDIEHNIQPIIFSPEDYSNLSETLYEIPYSFRLGQMVEEGGLLLYLRQDNVSDFNRIGVQSIYYGTEEGNASDIVWRHIKDFSTPTDIAGHNGVGVKSVRYYNSAGMPCDKPTANGLYIIVKEMEDGTVKVEKRNH